MDEDKLYTAYRETVKNLNRDWLPRDEDEEAITAEIALTEAYGLDRYTMPAGRKKRDKPATAAYTGGIFIKGSREADRLCGKRRSSGANELSRLRGSERCEACDDEEGGEPPCRESPKPK